MESDLLRQFDESEINGELCKNEDKVRLVRIVELNRMGFIKCE